MIILFRKIRQKVLEKNRLRKYLIYAIGEIVLALSGFPLSLQVNNWNEERKAIIKEVANLKSLKSELITSLDKLKTDYGRILKFHESTLNVQGYIL